MRVLITTDWYKPVVNGVVTSVVNLREELIRQGNEVKILTLSPDQRSYVDDEVYYIQSADAGKIYPHARFSICLWHPFFRLLANWKPDVIHSQCEFSTFLYAHTIARMTQAPIVHTYHTIYEDYTHYFSPSEAVGKTLVRKFSRCVLNHTDLVIAPTKKVERLLAEYEVEAPVETIPTGISLERFDRTMDHEERKQFRNSLGIGPEERVLVILGRLAQEKNVEEILGFLCRRKNLRCLIVGGGPYREVLEARVRELELDGRVIFTGMVPPEETGRYYRAGDIFVSASNSETQGLTYVEALACGLPAICRKDDCLEGVIENGYNGWQYETEEEFWQAADRLLNSEAEYARVSANASRSAQMFSKEIFAQRAEQAYRRAIFCHRFFIKDELFPARLLHSIWK